MVPFKQNLMNLFINFSTIRIKVIHGIISTIQISVPTDGNLRRTANRIRRNESWHICVVVSGAVTEVQMRMIAIMDCVEVAAATSRAEVV